MIPMYVVVRCSEMPAPVHGFEDTCGICDEPVYYDPDIKRMAETCGIEHLTCIPCAMQAAIDEGHLIEKAIDQFAGDLNKSIEKNGHNV